jgi:predicted phage terminase large subunit-like protein
MAKPLPGTVEFAEREYARRELIRRRIAYFAERFIPRFECGAVQHDVGGRLERFSLQVTQKLSPRLILLMPPRHSKSSLASQCLPAWHLGHNPHHEVMMVGHSQDLTNRFSRVVRGIIRRPEYKAIFPKTKLGSDSQALDDWMTTEGGGLQAKGVGGAIVGRGADVLCCDDLFAGMEDADNANTRENVWNWFMSDAYTRLSPGGGVLIIETWYNLDDIVGRLLEAMELDPEADRYEVIRYAAIAETQEWCHLRTHEMVYGPCPDPDEMWGSNKAWQKFREVGDALHPERWPLPELLRRKRTMATRLWSALYQQRPVPDQGAYFLSSDIRLLAEWQPMLGMRLYLSWDFGLREQQQNDYTVGSVIAHIPGDRFLLIDMMRFKGDSPAVVSAMVELWARWESADWLGQHPSMTLCVEDGHIWGTLEPMFVAACRARKLAVVAEVDKPLTDKLARARQLQYVARNGRFEILADQSWTDDIKREMLQFPAGAHDDTVDSSAMGVRRALSMGAAEPVAAPQAAQRPNKEKTVAEKIAAFGNKHGSSVKGLSHMSA